MPQTKSDIVSHNSLILYTFGLLQPVSQLINQNSWYCSSAKMIFLPLCLVVGLPKLFPKITNILHHDTLFSMYQPVRTTKLTETGSYLVPYNSLTQVLNPEVFMFCKLNATLIAISKCRKRGTTNKLSNPAMHSVQF